MDKLEKVIRGMECCIETIEMCWDNPKCPYNGCEDCMSLMIRDAIALLKVQEPRVMTLEDVQALQDGAVVWLEDNDKADVIPAIVNHIWNSLPNVASFTVAYIREVKADMLWYGTKWRCWTSRPTDEQREAVPWN